MNINCLRSYLQFLFPTEILLETNLQGRDYIMRQDISNTLAGVALNSNHIMFSLVESLQKLSIKDILVLIKDNCPDDCHGLCIFDTHLFMDITKNSSCKCKTQYTFSDEVYYINIYPENTSAQGILSLAKKYALSFNKGISQINSEQVVCAGCGMIPKITYHLFNNPEKILFECNYDEKDYQETLRLLRVFNFPFDKDFIVSEYYNYSLSSLLFIRLDIIVVLFFDGVWKISCNDQSFSMDLSHSLMFLCYNNFKLRYCLFANDDSTNRKMMLEHEWSRLSYAFYSIFEKKNTQLFNDSAFSSLNFIRS